jgi:hypothetical protein
MTNEQALALMRKYGNVATIVTLNDGRTFRVSRHPNLKENNRSWLTDGEVLGILLPKSTIVRLSSIVDIRPVPRARRKRA